MLWSERDEIQDAVEELCGDYCDGCVASGKAVEDLVSGLTKYKGVEADKVKCDGNHDGPRCTDPECWNQ